MDADFAAYQQALLDLKGLPEWQLLFVPKTRRGTGRVNRSSYARLEEAIESFARIFTTVDYAPYQKRLKARA
jgi:hypothetical protein